MRGAKRRLGLTKRRAIGMSGKIKPRDWRIRLLILMLLWAGSVSCSTPGGPAEVLCPIPSEAAVDDYERLVNSGRYRHHVRHYARLIGYCWHEVPPLPNWGGE